MSLTQNLVIVALITFSCFTLGNSLKCYTCDSEETCENAVQQECNPALANNTRAYLASYHYGVNMSDTSPSYQCFREFILIWDIGYIRYKGCIYDNMNGCRYPLGMLGNKLSCEQCDGNGCNGNGSGRTQLNLMAVLATIFVSSIVRYVWK